MILTINEYLDLYLILELNLLLKTFFIPTNTEYGYRPFYSYNPIKLRMDKNWKYAHFFNDLHFPEGIHIFRC